MSDLALQVRSLTCRYGELTAVEGFDLDIGIGEVVGLVGPNGSGKTTVLNAVSGFHRDRDGEISVFGQETAAMPTKEVAQKGVGRSFQLDHAFWQLSLKDGAFAYLVPGGREPVMTSIIDSLRGANKPWQAQASRAVSVFSSEGKGRTYAELSSGQLRGLSLDLLFLTLPNLLLLDEPFSGLAPDKACWLTRELRKVRSERRSAVLMVDHNLDHIRECCNRVVVMEAGRILIDDSPAVAFASPAVAAGFYGDTQNVE